jgi:hypothetical protein
MTAPQDGQLSIRLTPTIFLGVARFFIRPRIAIDGVVEKTRWGQHERTLPAGSYTVRIWFPWLVVPQAGLAERTVEVRPGSVTKLRYHTNALATAGGRMWLEDSVPIALPAAKLLR